jgi:uncharacterized repeat protein (TIGR01451 family)
MSYQIVRVSCFVLFLLAVLSMLSGGCFQQPYYHPVDPFAMDPVVLPDNRSDRFQFQNFAPNNNHRPQPVNIPQPNVVPNMANQFVVKTANLPPLQTQEIRQVIRDNNTTQNNYRYNNYSGNYSYNYPGHHSRSLPHNPSTTPVPPTYSVSPAYSVSPHNSSVDDSKILRSQFREINQVSLLEPQWTEDLVDDSGGIMIDPSLKDLGADVVAASGNGKEQISGGWRAVSSYGFWPQAEYLVDGGDGVIGDGVFGNAKILVDDDWSVRNLDVGDTAAHYDTVDGRTLVEASNRVHIYAPRFGAVRKVEGVVNTDHLVSLGAMNQQLRVGSGKLSERAGQTAQEFIAGYTRSREDLRGVRLREVGAGVGSNEVVGGYSNVESVQSYSDVLCLRKLGSAEIIHLAEGCQNARQWQGAEGVKIKASYRVPMSITVEEGVGQLFKVDDSGISGKSKLRLIKVASKNMAKSGDIIEFTLRFDNLGVEPLGNITIMDNLTTRLEFISGSAMSSLPSGFVVEPNGVASFTLRFEITDPLEAGKFGVIQFKCRVL